MHEVAANLDGKYSEAGGCLQRPMSGMKYDCLLQHLSFARLPCPDRTTFLATTKSLLDGFETRANLAEIILRMAKMDQSALAEFYDRTSRLVYGLVQRIVNNPSVAEEVTLDVFLQVWRQAEQYSETRSAPTTWLIMMARSRAIDSLRSHRKHKLEQPLDAAAQFADSSLNAEQTLAVRDVQCSVRSALDVLTPAHRQAIELAFFSGLSHAAIAEKLGQPLGTVKSWIRTGMIHMREYLRSDGNSL
jgi:RNA polymerase sigma-70 factor, ECF subfamily